MKRTMIAIAMLLVCAAAEARSRHHHAIGHARCTAGGCAVQLNDNRPRAWCGWFARHQLVSHDPGLRFNLARNWARWGRPSGPGVGVMVVWSHHVGMITGRDASGNWIVKSGNDGNRVRERPRSVNRAIAFRAG